jgi:hypothetical protein
MDDDPLRDARIRMARYWNIDGLAEAAIGLQVLIVPLFLYGLPRTARGSAGRTALVLAFAAGMPAASFLFRHLIQAIRRRTTYPRTGFVAYGSDGKPWATAAGLGLALILLPALLILRSLTTNWVVWLFALQGLLPAASLIYLGHLVKLVRLQVLGALFAAFGIAVAAADPGLEQGMTIFWAGIGAIFLVSGGLTFWQYVRRHPKAGEAL